ncbi:MAG: HlyD family efflux transporter periplasmic adaptor subunit [Candidatus Hydrogenedentes bacterium]|nr:HlyD family efflux transporter periplasmic adaptor subunit [Candidatus Hydrogenedentota bacterium]
MWAHVRHLFAVAAGRILLCLLILAGASGVAVLLASMYEPPAQAIVKERPVPVEAKQVYAEDVPVIITGYGDVRCLNTVRLAAEVPGRVQEVHSRLETGEIIPANELLFKIDASDYSSAKAQAEAQAAQGEATIHRLRTQAADDRGRLETLKRTRELAQIELDRVRELFQKDQVGTQSGVDAAEMQFNQVNDAYDQLAQVVNLYPTRIKEAESALAAAHAQLAMAGNNLARTEVRAPFNCRLKTVNLEQGQYVRPGELLLELADDSVLELSVPLDSRDARRWLRFRDLPANDGEAWFGALEPVKCRIRWTESINGHSWVGALHRVERLDEQTRTITVAVRVTHEEASAQAAGLPLVDGMFCSVEIPGSTMEQVFRLPRWAVSFEEKVFVAGTNQRLEVRPVEVVRTQGEETFVGGGLQSGEMVVVTRLVNPLPNTLLEIEAPAPAEHAP